MRKFQRRLLYDNQAIKLGVNDENDTMKNCDKVLHFLFRILWRDVSPPPLSFAKSPMIHDGVLLYALWSTENPVISLLLKNALDRFKNFILFPMCCRNVSFLNRMWNHLSLDP